MVKANKEGQRKAPILRFKGFTDDWEQRKLEDIAKVIVGGTPSTKINDYWNGEIPWMSSGEINKKRIYSTDKLITKLGLENSSAKFVPQDSVLIALAGQGKTRGTVAINAIKLTINQSLAGIIPTNRNHYEFIFYNLEKRYSELRRLSSGAGSRGGLNKKIIQNIKIKTPNLDEQSTISKLLRILDNLLTLYVKKSTLISSYITYFIKVFFNDGNFFEQKNTHNLEKQELKLGDILIKNNAKNKDLSILNVESISNKKGFVSQKEQFDNYQVASKDLSNYYVIHPKDFAYNPSRINVGSIAYKGNNEPESIVSPLYVSFKCNNDFVLDKYLWYWFKSANFERQRVKLSEGGVRDTLSFNQLSEMNILIPPFDMQKQTVSLLEKLINYKEKLDLKIENLKLITNSLFQNMFL